MIPLANQDAVAKVLNRNAHSASQQRIPIV